MKRFLFCLILFIFSPIISAEIKLSSVIILESNVPKECGIKIDIIDESILSSIKVTIKKNKKNNTSTYFLFNSDEKVSRANIFTDSQILSKIIQSKNSNKDYFEIESITNQNLTTQFFQELIISGAQIKVNEKKYQISGPIDSKVRLEYLFCTGEMFLPNYEQNK